jgi:hypothetical protein
LKIFFELPSDARRQEEEDRKMILKLLPTEAYVHDTLKSISINAMDFSILKDCIEGFVLPVLEDLNFITLS